MVPNISEDRAPMKWPKSQKMLNFDGFLQFLARFATFAAPAPARGRTDPSWLFDKMRAVTRGFFGAVLTSAVLVLVTWNIHDDSSNLSLLQTTLDDTPVQTNSLLQFQVPISELDQTKVGEVVSGQVPYGNDGRELAFTGQVTNGYGTSASTGSLTVNLTSLSHLFNPT
jgi:hypothetical protein